MTVAALGREASPPAFDARVYALSRRCAAHKSHPLRLFHALVVVASAVQTCYSSSAPESSRFSEARSTVENRRRDRGLLAPWRSEFSRSHRFFPMSLKLYCNRYGHFKDALVCSVNCVYRTRCRDFALYYDEHRQGVDALVANYYEARRETASARSVTDPKRTLHVLAAPVAQPAEMRALIRLEVKREMAEALYIWIDKEDRAEMIGHEEVIRRAERGSKANHIYKVSQEMELRFQLVPRKGIEKAKRAQEADAERAQARRRARASSTTNTRGGNAPVPFPSPAASVNETVASAPASSQRRSPRTRAPKAAGERR